MIRSNLCNYSDPYITVKRTMTVPNTAAAGAAVNNTNKKVIFKNCASFTHCITKINNTQEDTAQIIYILIPMYNLIDYSDTYSKTSRSLWPYYIGEPVLNNKGNIIDFNADDNNSNSFKFKYQITGQTENGRTKDVEIMVPLKYLTNFWGTLKILLIVKFLSS